MEAGCEGAEGEHRGDHRELAQLDADVEAEERGGDVLLGQADLQQRRREA